MCERSLYATLTFHPFPQALASAEPVLRHLQGSRAPTDSLAHFLGQCLEQLSPISRKHRGRPVSPSGVLEAFRSAIIQLWASEPDSTSLAMHVTLHWPCTPSEVSLAQATRECAADNDRMRQGLLS